MKCIAEPGATREQTAVAGRSLPPAATCSAEEVVTALAGELRIEQAGRLGRVIEIDAGSRTAIDRRVRGVRS